MCGICGWCGIERLTAEETARAALTRMCGALRHRGPDDEGHFLAPGGHGALGMRRLSIIDVAGGHQPISNEDGTVHVVFNGEIYNHHALRRDLEKAGHRFRTRSDTETLVHLYEEHGDGLVHHLQGMFGLAIWDARRNRLLLARDRLGIKPLYFGELAGGVLFASELRSFFALDGFAFGVDPGAVGAYLMLGYVPDPLSILSGVKKLPPGHLLTWTAEDGARVGEYWSPVGHVLPEIDEHEAVEELQRLLASAVEARLEAEVPLGAFLSGGLDSSTVVSLMTRALDRKVQTYSIGFEEPEYNEAPDAALAADALGTDHTELIVRPDVDRLVEDIVHMFDEPFGDASAIPTALVARLAADDVTVALSGDGGDELFGGYTRYLKVLDRRELPVVLRQPLRALVRHLPHGLRGRNRLLDMARTRAGQYATTVAHSPFVADGGIVRHDIASQVGSLDDVLAPLFAKVPGQDFPTQMMLVDTMSYLPGDILTKVDRTTMAVSVEARVPLLDHRLVEFAVALPSGFKIRNGASKWIFRKAVEGLVPPPVLEKPKQGFAVPLGRWFRHELRHRIDGLCGPALTVHEYVDARALARVAREHLVGRRNHQGTLWRVLVLDLWLRGLESGALTRPSQGRPRRVSTGSTGVGAGGSG